MRRDRRQGARGLNTEDAHQSGGPAPLRKSDQVPQQVRGPHSAAHDEDQRRRDPFSLCKSIEYERKEGVVRDAGAVRSRVSWPREGYLGTAHTR